MATGRSSADGATLSCRSNSTIPDLPSSSLHIHPPVNRLSDAPEIIVAQGVNKRFDSFHTPRGVNTRVRQRESIIFGERQEHLHP
jgi:hypothetical protein